MPIILIILIIVIILTILIIKSFSDWVWDIWKISQLLVLENCGLPPGWHGYRPRGTWKRLQGKGQGIRQTQRQKRSKGRLASLFPHRCCWTQKQDWTESGLIYKSLGFHLLRPSTSNSGRAWDNLSSCRSHQGLPRGDSYKAPHISYLIQVTLQKDPVTLSLWMTTCNVGE